MRYLRISSVIAIGVLTLVTSACTKQADPASNTTVNQAVNVVNTVNSLEPASAQQTVSEAVGKQRLVTHFVERWGTYSNQSNFENISEALPFMTESMQVYGRQLIATGRARPSGETFFGTTTVVLSTVDGASTDASAEYTVSTQRIEKTGDSERAYYQDIVVTLQKVAGEWKVNKAVWVGIK